MRRVAEMLQDPSFRETLKVLAVLAGWKLDGVACPHCHKPLR